MALGGLLGAQLQGLAELRVLLDWEVQVGAEVFQCRDAKTDAVKYEGALADVRGV